MAVNYVGWLQCMLDGCNVCWMAAVYVELLQYPNIIPNHIDVGAVSATSKQYRNDAGPIWNAIWVYVGWLQCMLDDCIVCCTMWKIQVMLGDVSSNMMVFCDSEKKTYWQINHIG